MRNVPMEELNHEHLANVVAFQKQDGAPVNHYPDLWREDLDWLADRLSRFEDLKQRCQRPLDEHCYGVVYAIRFDAEDLDALEDRKNMGVAAFSIAPEHLIAKALIPADAEALDQSQDEMTQRLSVDGIVKRLRFGIYPSGPDELK